MAISSVYKVLHDRLFLTSTPVRHILLFSITIVTHLKQMRNIPSEKKKMTIWKLTYRWAVVFGGMATPVSFFFRIFAVEYETDNI